MKKYFKILCLLLLVSACRNDEEIPFTIYKNIQNINALETTDLTNPGEGKFFNPKFTATGNKAVFTSEDFTGLWYFDFKTGIINQLNPSIGAGINFDVATSGDKVYFRLQSTSAKGDVRNYSIASQELNSKTINILYTSQYYLSGPRSLRDGKVAFLLNEEIKILDPETKSFIDDYSSEEVIAFAAGNSIKILVGNNSEDIIPVSDGKITWLETSPQNDRIYFTSSEKGTGEYIIKSKEINWLGKFKYFNCSKASNMTVYSFNENYDYDLFVSAEGDAKKYNITNTNNKNEMFPYLSNDGTRLIFNTADGIIKVMKLLINSGSNV